MVCIPFGIGSGLRYKLDCPTRLLTVFRAYRAEIGFHRLSEHIKLAGFEMSYRTASSTKHYAASRCEYCTGVIFGTVGIVFRAVNVKVHY